MSALEPKSGRTTPLDKGVQREGQHMKINYNADTWDVSFSDKLKLFCIPDSQTVKPCGDLCFFPLCCSFLDKERSYMYIRENSTEHNVAYRACCGCCISTDDVKVQYFDRPPQYSQPPTGPPRKSKQNGAMALERPDQIKIWYDAEIALERDCGEKCSDCLDCCSVFDAKRSYLYIRENSLETNVAKSTCCGCGAAKDSVTVQYFDRKPYKPPAKIEVFDLGYQCCCMTCPKGLCCGCLFKQKRVVLMPSENCPWYTCCCCFSNRVSKLPCCCLGNCCGCGAPCGCNQPTGNPVIYRDTINPQPKNPEEFAQYAQFAINGITSDGSGQGVVGNAPSPTTSVVKVSPMPDPPGQNA